MSKSPERITYQQTQLPSLDAEWANILRRLGLAALVTVAATTTGAGLSLYQRVTWLRPLAVGLLCGSITLLALALAGVITALWTDLESITQRDLDQSGAIGDRLVLLRARNSTEPDTDPGDALRDFVTACATDTSARRWEPIIGRTQYTAWRDQLIAAGHARWTSPDHRQGWELTAPPDEVITAIN